ncbi:mucin-22-like isoform X1 [Astyanax mexicanus]|uniref:Mucin-22-like isoform X1 n=1 Tax=Astyanax mexicanus TaxID=7994 RepID=A0A8T2MIV7_ASTMX|nr:mucin-22-like isoform X1 [Astyanax mexicanus]
MEGSGFLWVLLLCGRVLLVSSEVLHVKGIEGNIAVLRCGKLSKGSVTWSREINGQKVDILNNNNGQVTQYSAGSDERYSSGGNPWLIIRRVSQSDAGRYYCNGETVELTVTKNGKCENLSIKVSFIYSKLSLNIYIIRD